MFFLASGRVICSTIPGSSEISERKTQGAENTESKVAIIDEDALEFHVIHIETRV